MNPSLPNDLAGGCESLGMGMIAVTSEVPAGLADLQLVRGGLGDRSGAESAALAGTAKARPD